MKVYWDDEVEVVESEGDDNHGGRSIAVMVDVDATGHVWWIWRLNREVKDQSNSGVSGTVQK